MNVFHPQVIKMQDEPDYNSRIFENLGQGISQGIQSSLNQILQQREQEKQSGALEGILSKYPSGDYSSAIKEIATSRVLTPEMKKFSADLLQNMMKQEASQKESAAMSRLLSGGYGAPSSEMQDGQRRRYTTQDLEGLSPQNVRLLLDAENKAEKLQMQKEDLELKKSKIASQEKSRQDKKLKPFIDKLNASTDASLNIINSLENMKALRQKGNLGITSSARGLFSGETRADAGAYDTYGSQLLSVFKAQFPRGITQGEFKKIEEKWLPKSTNSDERNEAIESAYEEIAKTLSKKLEIAEKYRREDGSFPENIESLVNKEMSKDLESLKNKLINDSPSFSVGDTLDNLPSASSVKKGEGFQSEDGSIYVSDGKKWKKIR